MAFLVLLFQSRNSQLKLKCVNFQQPVGCPSRSMYLTPHSPRMASAAGMQPCPQRTPQHPLSPARVPQLNSPHTPQVTLTEKKQILKTLESLLYIIKVGKTFWATILFVNQGKLKSQLRCYTVK